MTSSKFNCAARTFQYRPDLLVLSIFKHVLELCKYTDKILMPPSSGTGVRGFLLFLMPAFLQSWLTPQDQFFSKSFLNASEHS